MTARAVLLKLRDALRCDLAVLRSPFVPAARKPALLLARYGAVLRDRRSFAYLGRPLSYDNRFTPVLMGSYLEEVRELDHHVDLASLHTVLDVGANVGQFAATVSRRAPHLRGWSFEPNPAIAALLRENLQGSDWEVVPFALSSADGERSLWFIEGKSAQGSFERSNAESGLAGAATETTVPAIALTADARGRLGIPDHVDLVKVDVEGAERDALGGLGDLSWTYMALEVSTGLRSGIGLDEALDLLETTTGARPEVLWLGPADEDSIARDVILRRGPAARVRPT